jgi:hypothetical protein
MSGVAAPLGDDAMWESIDARVEEADFFLEQMSKDLVPPEMGPNAQLARAIAMTGAIVSHPWQPRFYFHLNAFLAAARSVPEIIMFQFGVDLKATKTVKNWVKKLLHLEQRLRNQFADRFRPSLEGIAQDPVSTARNITVHRQGTAPVNVAVVDAWGNAHQAGPTTHLDDAAAAPIGAELAAGEQAPAQLAPKWSDFELTLHLPPPALPRVVPLETALRNYLQAVKKAVVDARLIVQHVYGTLTPTLTAPPLGP